MIVNMEVQAIEAIGYRKRTRIAHSDNLQWIPRPLCNPKTCPSCVDGVHIRSAQQGPAKRKGVRNKQDTCSLDMLHGLPRFLTEESSEFVKPINGNLRKFNNSTEKSVAKKTTQPVSFLLSVVKRVVGICGNTLYEDSQKKGICSIIF